VLCCAAPIPTQIKGLTDKREKLSTALQQLQASRDKAAAALAKLKGAYETMAAENHKLRSNNAELQGLIDGVKQQLHLQGVAVPTPKEV
jgi:chromosome segregation ATPase